MDLLMTLGIVLLILWLLGLVTSYTLGGFIHILSGVGHCCHPDSRYSGAPADSLKRGSTLMQDGLRALLEPNRDQPNGLFLM